MRATLGRLPTPRKFHNTVQARVVAEDVAADSSRLNSRRWTTKGSSEGIPGHEGDVQVSSQRFGGMLSGEGSGGADGVVKLIVDPTMEPTLVNEAQVAYEDMAEVLSKSPKDRTRDDLRLLQGATEGVKFFRSLNDPAVHIELCRSMTVKRTATDFEVFRQGDLGTTFYVIVSGAVKIYIQDGKEMEPGICVCVLEDGDSFGELALLGNGKRAATAVTAMPTTFLLVEKDSYDESLAQVKQAELHTRMEFLRRVFLFTDWSDAELERLAKVVTLKKYEKNTTIIRQSTSTDHMYFIISGKCRVIKQMKISTHLHEKLASSRSMMVAQAGGPMGDGPSASMRSLSMREEGPLLELCELIPFQFFGERALLAGKKGEHTSSVVSSTNVECLLLSKYDFHKHINKRTQDFMQTYADKFYFDEDRIRRTIQSGHKWEAYKQGLVREVMSPRESPRR